MKTIKPLKQAQLPEIHGGSHIVYGVSKTTGFGVHITAGPRIRGFGTPVTVRPVVFGFILRMGNTVFV